MPAEQNPKPSFGIGETTRHQRQFRLRIGQLAPRRVQCANVRQAAFVAGRRQGRLLLEDRRQFTGEAPLATQIDHLEVGGYRLRQNADLRGLKVRLGGQVRRTGSQRGIAVAAPKVRLVGEVRAQRIGGQVKPVRQREAEGIVHIGAQPEFLKLGAQAGVGRRIESAHPKGGLGGRKAGRGGDAGPGPSLLDPGNRFSEAGACGERHLHDPVENRILKRLPPLTRFVPKLRPGLSDRIHGLRRRLRDRRGRHCGTG